MATEETPATPSQRQARTLAQALSANVDVNRALREVMSGFSAERAMREVMASLDAGRILHQAMAKTEPNALLRDVIKSLDTNALLQRQREALAAISTFTLPTIDVQAALATLAADRTAEMAARLSTRPLSEVRAEDDDIALVLEVAAQDPEFADAAEEAASDDAQVAVSARARLAARFELFYKAVAFSYYLTALLKMFGFDISKIDWAALVKGLVDLAKEGKDLMP